MANSPEGKSGSPEKQAERLGLAVEEFINCIERLSAEQFCQKIDDWAPRDITAHLVGWNECTVDDCRSIMRGETPLSLIDPGDDFSKFNAVLVLRYSARDAATLIGQMKTSAEKLRRFVQNIDIAEWQNDHGLTYRGSPVTAENSVDGLIYDYVNHREQIENWMEKRLDRSISEEDRS